MSKRDLTPFESVLDAFFEGCFWLLFALGLFLIFSCAGCGRMVTHRCGYYDGFNEIGVVLTVPECGPPEIALVHEIGHALGLQHSKDPSSVMYPEAQKGRTLEQAADSLIGLVGMRDRPLFLMPSPAMFPVFEKVMPAVNKNWPIIAFGPGVWVIEDDGAQ